MKRLAVIRLRGKVNVRSSIEDTLKILRLRNINNCVIIDDRKEYRGMLQKAKDYITWGEVDASAIEEMLRNRGWLAGGERLTEGYVKKYQPKKPVQAKTEP